MRKIPAALLALALCSCAHGTAGNTARALETAPFTATAEVFWQGESYAAAVCLGEGDALTLSLQGGALTAPVTFSVADGVQEVAQGDLSLRIPLEDALPNSIAIEFLTALSTLGSLGAVPPGEDGSFCYESGNVSLTVSADGTWDALALEDGRFTFSDFTLTPSVT